MTLAEMIAHIVGDRRNTFSLEFSANWVMYDDDDPEEGNWHAQYYPDTPVGFYDARAHTPEEACEKLIGYLAADKARRAMNVTPPQAENR